jgi:hypothetical protein
MLFVFVIISYHATDVTDYAKLATVCIAVQFGCVLGFKAPC